MVKCSGIYWWHFAGLVCRELIPGGTQNHEIGVAGLSLVALSIPLNIRSFKKASHAIRQD